MNKFQYLSIQIINSKYRVIFTIFIYCIIYSLFYYDKTLAFCMTNENISTDADSKEHIIRSLHRNFDAMQHERDHFRNLNSSLVEENIDLYLENLRLKTVIEEQKVTLDLETGRNLVLEEEKQKLASELRKEKRVNINLTKELIKMKTKLTEEKKRLSTEDSLELLGTSAESSDIEANKKRKI